MSLWYVQGGSIKWLVKKFRVQLADKNHDMNLNEEVSNHVGLTSSVTRVYS